MPCWVAPFARYRQAAPGTHRSRVFAKLQPPAHGRWRREIALAKRDQISLMFPHPHDTRYNLCLLLRRTVIPRAVVDYFFGFRFEFLFCINQHDVVVGTSTALGSLGSRLQSKPTVLTPTGWSSKQASKVNRVDKGK